MMTYAITQPLQEVARETSCQAMVLLDTLKRLTSANRAADIENYGEPAVYARSHHYHDRHWWTYGSYDDIAACTGCLSRDQVVTAVKKLIAADYIVQGNFNWADYDKTSWYALTDKGLQVYGIGKKTEKSPEAKPEEKPAEEKKKQESGKEKKKASLKKEKKQEARQINADKLRSFMAQIGVIDQQAGTADKQRWSEIRLAGQIDQGLYDAGMAIITEMQADRKEMAR